MVCNSCGTYISSSKCKICGQGLKVPSKKKGIKKVSDKKSALDKIYYERRSVFLQGKRCAVYPHLQAVDVHHMKGRGIHYLDESTWLAVSRQGHKHIEENPTWAKQAGYSQDRLS